MNENIENERNLTHPLIIQVEEYIKNQETNEINDTITDLEELMYYIKFKKGIITILQKNETNNIKNSEIEKKIGDLYTDIKDKSIKIELKNTEFSKDYNSIKVPDEKIRFLGEQIKHIESDIIDLESKTIIGTDSAFK